MEIHEQQHGAVTVLRPSGPLTAEDAGRLRTSLIDTMRRTLGRCVLDAADIPFVDSQGLEALLDVCDHLAESGQTLKLCGVTETVREVLELTELASQFEHFEDVQNAVRSFL